jgi:hypothetical protein
VTLKLLPALAEQVSAQMRALQCWRAPEQPTQVATINIPSIFPFSKLRLRDRETLQWVGYNPTFHRFTAYGLAITDSALYLCALSWLFARWCRYRLSEISNVECEENRVLPTMTFRVGEERVTFRTPYDSHKEESGFDRKVISSAVEQLCSLTR